ncbi:TnpV protein [Flavonifractor plautii]
MQRFITDERTGIRYELIGDYYYPCLTAEEKPLLSRYGRMRERYLKEHKRVLYYRSTPFQFCRRKRRKFNLHQGR